MPDGAKPGPGGWNRIHFIVDDLDAEVGRLRDAGARFRNEVVEGPGGKQILLQDPSGNLVELFQPAEPLSREPPARPADWIGTRATPMPRGGSGEPMTTHSSGGWAWSTP